MSSASIAKSRGNFIRTASGRQFRFAAPVPEDFVLEDIAESLAKQCRFLGHCRRVFYSVAQHSVIVSHLVPPAHARTALMHDATEGYIGDLPRPLKGMRELDGFVGVEDRLYQLIAARYGLETPIPEVVHQADAAACAAEMTLWMARGAESGENIQFNAPESMIEQAVELLSAEPAWGWERAEGEFLRRAQTLELHRQYG